LNSTNRHYKCIAIDAVGTTIHPSPPAAEVYYQVARRFGSRLAQDEIARRFGKAFRETEQGDLAAPPDVRLITSEAREQERWRQIVRTVIDDISLSDAPTCFETLFAHFARPAAWECFADVPAVLAQLKADGYRLALASNFDRRLHAVCDGIAALRPVDLRVISSEAGCRKPGRGFFEALVSQAGCLPEEVLMVGDDEANDIVGARQAGLDALLIDRRGGSRPGVISSLAELPQILAAGY